MDQVTLKFTDVSLALYCAKGDGPEVKAALDKLVAAYDEMPAKDARIAVLCDEVDRARERLAAIKRGR